MLQFILTCKNYCIMIQYLYQSIRGDFQNVGKNDTDKSLCNFAVCFIRKKDENYLKILSLGGSFRLFTSKGGEKIRSLLKK